LSTAPGGALAVDLLDMQTLNELETAPIPFQEEEKNHTRRLLVGVLCALILTGALFGGYLLVRKRHDAEVARVAAANANTKLVVPPKIEVFVDDPILKDKQPVLGGTLHNISSEPLSKVSVELLLRRRAGAVETKEVQLDPTNLAPDGTGRYSLTLLAKDYSTATVGRVLASENRLEIPFKTLPGARRPLEPPPAGRTVIIKRPTSGGEFINSPEKPQRIP